MQSNTDPKPSSLFSKTDNIETAIEDAQLLLQYIATHGIVIDGRDLSTLINSKFLYREGTLDVDSEHLFWLSLTNVAHAVKPMTIQSLRAIDQSFNKKGKKRVGRDIDKVVLRYGVLSIISLIALLVIQVYLIVGTTTRMKSKELFEQKEAIIKEIEGVKKIKDLEEELAIDNDHDIRALQDQYKEIEQKQHANYKLLISWNKIWLTLLMRDEFQGKLINYRETDYNSQFVALKDKIAQMETSQEKIDQAKELIALKEILREKQIERHHDIELNRFFLNSFASEYVAAALEKYILPLLYGLLGAVFFVLRTLSKELQDLTYLPMMEINYRLRIPTGALAGLTISWFLTGDNLDSNISGFAMSFLVGYNVEVLFSVMDKIISQFTSKDSSSERAPYQEQPADKGLSSLESNR